jgi:hypothetical protein
MRNPFERTLQKQNIIATQQGLDIRDKLKSACRGELASMVLELRRRRNASPDHMATMTRAEQATGQFLVSVLRVAVEQFASEHQPIPISLSDVTSETLQQILQGSQH